jgi:hypothetical protein
LCCAAIVAAIWSGSAAAAVIHPYLSSFGSFTNVQGVATDAAGDVYVFDAGASTIDKFDASGNPVNFAATGTNEITGVSGGGASENELAVDNSTGSTAGDIYVANGSPSAVQIFSAEGSPIGTLSPEAGVPWSGEACGVGVDPSGDVYIGNYSGPILKYVPTANPVTNADYSSSISGASSPCNLALDQAGNVFAETWSDGPITRYEPSQFGSLSAAGSLVDSEGSSLAIDPATQEVYVDAQSKVAQFGAHGEPFEVPVITFASSGEGAISGSHGIAIGPLNDDVYVSDGNGQLSVFGPAVSLPTATTGSASEFSASGAKLSGTVNPEGAPLTECFFEYGEASSYGETVPCAESPTELGSGTEPVAVHADATGLAPDVVHHFRLVAVAAGGPVYGEDQVFSQSPPVISAYVTAVASTSATLRGEIDPLTNDTTYHFQYGTDTNYGSTTPDTDVGSFATTQSAVVHLQGLAPDTTYHYRLVATSVAGTTVGPDLMFITTSIGGPLQLLDGRQWEQVSPTVKHGAGIIPQRREGDVLQASEAGDAITYVARNPIESEPEGNSAPEEVQILARRTATGSWANRTLTTRTEEVHPLPAGRGLEYRMFSPDLSRQVIEPLSTTPLAPSATTQRTQYVRDELACAEPLESCFTPVLTAANTMPGAKWDGNPRTISMKTKFVDASADQRHLVIQSKAKLITSAPKEGLYEWSEGTLQFASVNEASEAVDGELGGNSEANVRNAISSDGSRVFWCETAPFAGTCTGPLFMRDTAKGETIRLDPAGDTAREFQIATEDGSRVFFTIDEGSPVPELWECDITEAAGKFGCDAREVAPEIEGLVVGINENGTVVDFVSPAALAPGAEAGADNLYASHLEDGKWEAHFIARLSSEDYPDWGGESVATSSVGLPYVASRMSPNGQYLEFMSERSLTGYDNRDAKSGEPDEEVFLYRDEGRSGTLVCASCNPSGGRPQGVFDEFQEPMANSQAIWNNRWVAASVPGWDNINLSDAIRPLRFLSNDGRLFFNSSDALVQQDSDGIGDVYEYEPGAVGSCTQSRGCLDLISSGTGRQESVFLESSTSGDDVFFLSSAQLVSQDKDGAFDVYDAHVCTSAVPCVQASVSPPPCSSGESCKAAPTPQPTIFGPPASATFVGAGNPSPVPAAPAPKAKPLTRAQKLAKALKTCRKDKSKSKRISCEKQARKRYGLNANAKPHKSNSGKSKAHKGGK